MPVILEWIFYDALKTLEVILAFDEQHKDAKFVRCYLTYIWEGEARKAPTKSSQWNLFPEPEHKMSATTNNSFFAKREWPEKIWNVLYNVWLLSFEPGLKAAWTRSLSVLPGPGPGPCRLLVEGTATGILNLGTGWRLPAEQSNSSPDISELRWPLQIHSL
jgi:hypothetical protein